MNTKKQLKNISTLFTCLCLLIFFSFTFLNCVNSISKDYEDQITKSFKVQSGQLLYLKADLGSVSVNSWIQNEVRIVVTRKADTSSKRRAEEIYEDLELKFEQNSQGVQVFAEYYGSKNWFGGHRRLKLHFEIMVPRKFDLEINTSGGSIDINEIEGKNDLHTSGGSISGMNIIGSLKAHTSGGSIKVSDVDGETNVHTSGGSIILEKVRGNTYGKTSGGTITATDIVGDTEVYTSGGSLKLKAIQGNLKGKTSGGSINAEVTKEIDKECSLITSGGSINLYLPRDTAANIDAYTSGGHVSTDFPITVKGVIKNNKLVGKINDGGPEIYLRTSGGSIYIKEL